MERESLFCPLVADWAEHKPHLPLTKLKKNKTTRAASVELFFKYEEPTNQIKRGLIGSYSGAEYVNVIKEGF